MKKQLFLLFSITSLALFAQAPVTETHMLESTPVRLQTIQYGNSPGRALFLNVHENESTSVAAGKEYLKDRNGTFMTILQKGQRNVAFTLRGVPFQFDPNRMFTKTGRIKNLKLLNKRYIDAAEETVEEFSDKIISRVKNARIVVTLHNNTNGKPLSVNSYRNKYVNKAMDTDDFVLTTDQSIFEKLKAKKINAVWETTSTSPDDGSLAYYCSQKNIPYINVEAQIGHKSEQLRMLNALTDIISTYTR